MTRVHARAVARTARVSLGALAFLGGAGMASAQQSMGRLAPLAAWPEPVAAVPIGAHAPQALGTRPIASQPIASQPSASQPIASQPVALQLLPLTLAPAGPIATAAPSGIPLPRLLRADGWKLGALASAALIVATADRRGDAWARRRDVIDSKGWQRAGNVGDVTGTWGAVGIGPAAWLLGRVRGDSGTAVLGLRTTEAVAASGVMIFAIKAIAGRTRPYASADNSPTHWDLFGGRRSDSTRSFASGHSALSAAAAVTLAAEWRRQGRAGWSSVGPPLVYALASVVAGSRVVDRQHWISDVLTGSGVGILNALLVRRWHDAHPGSRLDRAFLRR